MTLHGHCRLMLLNNCLGNTFEIQSGTFRERLPPSFRGKDSSYQVLDYKYVCSFIHTCNWPASDQPEPGRITEIEQNIPSQPPPWGSFKLPGEGECMFLQQRRSSTKGSVRGVEKALKRFRIWRKRMFRGPSDHSRAWRKASWKRCFSSRKLKTISKG